MAVRVEVVMSTYRARPDWLRAQLASIWAQQDVEVSVLVRDDGSPDRTADLVEELLTGRRGRLVRGANLGPARSFLEGLRLADPQAPYVAWADQDDVWVPSKLARAVAVLERTPSPALYCARVELVDEQLRSRGLHPVPGRGLSFANALVQNVATGCTIVLDRPAVDLLAREVVEGVVMHDAWAYLVLTGCGSTVYDPEPVVRYRQHGDNAVGVAATPWRRWWGRARRQLSTGHERVHTVQDAALLRHYGVDLRPEARDLLERHLEVAHSGPGRRARWALRGAPHRQDAVSDLVYKALFCAGRT